VADRCSSMEIFPRISSFRQVVSTKMERQTRRSQQRVLRVNYLLAFLS
jgi:hypothetical protein